MVKSAGSIRDQTPSWPRKSGMPDSVEIPAPRESRIRLRSLSAAATSSMDAIDRDSARPNRRGSVQVSAHPCADT